MGAAVVLFSLALTGPFLSLIFGSISNYNAVCTATDYPFLGVKEFASSQTILGAYMVTCT